MGQLSPRATRQFSRHCAKPDGVVALPVGFGVTGIDDGMERIDCAFDMLIASRMGRTKEEKYRMLQIKGRVSG